MRTLLHFALYVGSAAALLAGCGVLPGMPQSRSVPAHAGGSAVPSYLYVADPVLHAVVAFDGSGNEVAEKKFNGPLPEDVVTDSRGHVYVNVFTTSGSTSVQEYTHDLGRLIAVYRPFGLTYTMAVDASDNLYVESQSAEGFEQNILRYPYGSTRARHNYRIRKRSTWTTTMAGISVRGNALYTMIIFSAPVEPLIRQCFVNGSGECHDVRTGGPNSATCGFTTANRHEVYGIAVSSTNKIEYDTIKRSWSKTHHDIDLPPGYGLGVQCNFHSYKGDVWTTVQGSKLAEALEVDVDHRKVIDAVGAGYLKHPTAAYYGNGLSE
ncbi:MAG TPA: hypothetical protein VIW73_04350 [Candidatus Cybelea sp.]